ncbi:hypothetical protein TH61_07045 [Rufibacter sp. DG15C]|uniref:DUF3857 domain-containing protein n=1 Tax=Rufibacter sp. DG15C TaxID=1379909 RepID=UPI00078EC581|nr:transglutaminase domain-containing protein [Rufibacter sp. DG15C]AMM50988.1 hypothetical protein TH61_07045 [Rufibacter sp. DG15C]
MRISTLLPFRGILLVLCLLGSALVQAQDAPVKYGKVTEEELKMTSYAKDTSAAAVILADYGRSYFTVVNNSMKLNFERVMRIKVLKKAGYEMANITVPYYQQSSSSKELVLNIKATTYNLENNQVVKVKMDNSAIFDEKESENWYNKKFTLPAVKEGSVLDISYAISSDFIFNFRDWTFQGSIPVVHSEYRASIPEYYEYKNFVQGYEPMVVNEVLPGSMTVTTTQRESSGGNIGVSSNTTSSSENVRTVNHRWVMKDVPAITAESYITTIQDYIAKIEFELEWIRYPYEMAKRVAGNWNKLTDEFLLEDRFGAQLNRTGYFKNEVASLQSVKDTLEKVNTIYDYVKKNVKWNGKGGVLATNTLRKAFEIKSGNAADINLMLVAMLRDAGLESYPIVLSTRDHGRVPTHAPMLNKFNYVVAFVKTPKGDLLLDATDPFMPLGQLPKHCLNGQGWLVAKDQGSWIPLVPQGKSTELLNAELSILPTGIMSGKVQESSSGLLAVNMRTAVKEAGEAKYMEKLVNAQNQFERKKPVLKDLAQIQKPISLEYEITSTGDGQAKDIIYVNPMLLKARQENPFKHTERKYPVDFGHGTEEVYVCNFTIPEGYVVEEMPKGVMMSLPDNGGKFTYMLQQTGNKVQVMSKVTISRPIFYAQEYEALKQFYSQIVAKHAEQIVLKKKI